MVIGRHYERGDRGMTKEELIKAIEESIQSCTNEDEEYVRGWKCAMVNVLEKVKELFVPVESAE